MIKDVIYANEAVTHNQKELLVLRENFPSCFRADGSFDLVRFQEFLKDKIDISHEGYELKFLGKNYAKMLASLDTETVIVPDEAHNSLPENANSENVYISGDNLASSLNTRLLFVVASPTATWNCRTQRLLRR